ncbi:hypothetical protein [Rubrivirga sp. IMCC45206]|uniref:hypothetical protein n=1 Tax=Rubrivirga sp. IMCC45206 TaxID=3391614 RepID=UPI0039901EC9
MRSSTLIPLLAIGGCSLVGEPAPEREVGAAIQTDALVYTARYEGGEGTYRQYGFDVVARFANPTADTVYLGRAYPDQPRPDYGVLLVNDEDDWGSAYGGAIFGVGHDRQIAVAPGEVRVDTLRLRGPNAWDGMTDEPFGRLEGEMRLIYVPQGCRGDGACRLPRSLATLNVFRVGLE